MQAITIEHTDVGSIDLETLKWLAANAKVSAEIHGSGDVYIAIES